MPDTVVFIPGCKTKSATGRIVGRGIGLTQADLPNAWNLLQQGRQQIAGCGCIDHNSPLTSAIYLYQGRFYEPLQQHIPAKLQEIEDCQLRLIHISPGYGIIDCGEPIHDYDAEMINQVATIWQRVGLVKIISVLLLTLKPSKVFGYFYGIERWNFNHPMYRYFFTEGLRMACNNGLKLKCGGCFYRTAGQGFHILRVLGGTFVDHNKNGLDCAFADNVLQNGRIDGRVRISFDPII